jgi:hypothetical protein
MYFWMVRLHTRIPSLSNSPRMRSAPQSRLFLAISLINAIVSVATLGLAVLAFDLYLQKRRNPSRCQRRRVSGWTIKSACLQVRTVLARSTKRIRSRLVHIGRWICRRRMMSWWRKSAFSATSSDFPLARSATVPSSTEVFGGLVQLKNQCWSV